jgi:tetratricopeptide (TPR) repeat protein
MDVPDEESYVPQNAGMSVPYVFEGIFNPRHVDGNNPSMNPVNDCATMQANTIGDSRNFDDRIEPENPIVHNAALRFARTNSGALTSNQIRSIWDYLLNGDESTKGWIYKSDPNGQDYFAYASETLEIGKEIGSTGSGDCDDFAIVISALIESIGGTTRMVTGCGNDGCHAYSEVYLGKLDENTYSIMKDLMYAYGVEKIYTHIDETTGNVWLNLDWWAYYPGGNLYSANSARIVRIGYISESSSPTASDSGGDARELVNRGFELYQEGKKEEALKAYDEAIQIMPTDADAYYSKGVTLCDLGMTYAANAAFDKAGELDPFSFGGDRSFSC